ncbi:MAG: BNR repeat-containing glycosyl hydrolase, partial [bacterium]
MAASRFLGPVLFVAFAFGIALLASPRFDTPRPSGAQAYGPPPVEVGERMAGPDRERLFFDDWHGDEYGAVLPIEKLQEIGASIAALGGRNDQLLGGSGWELLGPSGMQTTTLSTLYSGRILDIDGQTVAGNLHFWFAAASGGLWDYDATLQVYAPLTETLPTQAVGTVSVDPANAQNIVIGTGEFGIRGGLGIFYTTNGGDTWTAATGSPNGAVHRIRHITSTRLVCAAETGWYVSTNGGAAWTQQYGGTFFDLA